MNIDTLYQQAIQGDKKTESALFEKLRERFRLFAHRKVWNSEAAEEIVQEALTTVAEQYHDIQIDSSFAGWAHRVLENKFLSYLQSKRRQAGRNVSLESTEFLTDGWEPNHDLRRRLEDCFKQVGQANTRYARILNFQYQGFKIEEICQKLDTQISQTYTILSRARSMLKGCLEKGKVGR